MKIAFLLGSLALPLAAGAQKLPDSLPPVTYHAGKDGAGLFRRDTLGRVALFIRPYGEAVVVGRYSPRWVVVKREGFLYLLPVQSLADYTTSDAEPLPIDPQSHLIMFESVVAVPGASQAELAARARAWIAKTYPAGTATLQPQDPASGQLQLKGQRPAAVHLMAGGVARLTTAGVVRHTLVLYLKDGRYKYVLTDLTHDAAGVRSLKSGGGLEQEHASLYGYAGIGSQDAWSDLRTEAFRDVRHLLDDLQAAMTLQPADKVQPVSQKKDPRDF